MIKTHKVKAVSPDRKYILELKFMRFDIESMPEMVKFLTLLN